MTKILTTLSRWSLVCSTAALSFSAQAEGTRQEMPDARARMASVARQPFPSSLARYQARLFELTDPSEKGYDAGLAGRLRNLVEPQLAKNGKFLTRLTSGPTAPGSYVVTEQRAYIYYGTCQAHQCDNTTMDLLFDPVRNRMVGKLLDRCMPGWLGQPDNEEMALLDQRHRASFPATATACAGEK